MQERANQPKQKIEYNFDVTKHIRLVPPFQEKEVDKYFLHFEKVAENKVIIMRLLKNLFSKVMSWSQKHIDKNLEIVKKDSNQTHVEFARNKEQLFDRWCCSKKIDQNYDKLRQLMLVEEFKRCIQSDVKTFLDEKQVETLEEAARLADDYYLTHKVSFIAKPKPTSSHPQKEIYVW